MVEEFTEPMKDLMDKNRIRFSRNQLIYLKFKGLLDIVCSFCGLVLLTPVFLVIAAAIKIEDPKGCVMYKQERIGRQGRNFPLYKFRSMRMGTPELSTHEFNDAGSYVTKVGHFIRHASIDELPQLWNVLIGNMSLVGPRPLLPRERDVHMLRFYYGLYQVRPGITGMAQTNGRDDMNDYDKVRWDRTYVQNISFMTDLKLLVKTFFKVIKKEGVLDKNGPPARSTEAQKETLEQAVAECEQAGKSTCQKGEKIG